jgi:molybdopterin converting factor small subunit
MQITVEYAAQIKRAAGKASESFNFHAPCSVQVVLRKVAERHGDPLETLLFDVDRRLHPSILLFVGDAQVRWDQSIELKDRDVLTILSPISGG